MQWTEKKIKKGRAMDGMIIEVRKDLEGRNKGE